MKIETVMSRHVEFASGEDSVAELAVTMGEIDVGALPIGHETDLQGIVTDRDILYRVVAQGRDPNTTKAREILSFPVTACRPDDSLQTAMELMAGHRIRRLAVTDGAGKVVGWVTLADLSRKLLLESGTVQEALQDITRDSGD